MRPDPRRISFIEAEAPSSIDYVAWIEDNFRRQPHRSQAALARRLGVSRAIVTFILSRKRRIRADELQVISNFFDSPIPTDLVKLSPGTKTKSADTTSVTVNNCRKNHVEAFRRLARNLDVKQAYLLNEALELLFAKYGVGIDDTADHRDDPNCLLDVARNEGVSTT